MQVDVVLFAHFSPFQPDGKGGRHARTFDLREGMTIADVIAMLELPDEPRVIFVNNRHAPEEQVLLEGDRLAIFPPVAGG
ncbi:MAG: MoaD/ThiS family protein [Coriobacteriia bacterium]